MILIPSNIHSTNSNHNSIALNMHSSITNTQINHLQPPSVHLCTYNAPNLQHHQSSESAPQKLLQNTQTFQDPLLNQQAIISPTLELAWVHNLLKHSNQRSDRISKFTYIQCLEWDGCSQRLPCSLLHFSTFIHTMNMRYLISH